MDKFYRLRIYFKLLPAILILNCSGLIYSQSQRIDTWVDFVEDDNFKEGIYSKPVGAKSLELISFYRMFLPFQSNENQDLYFEVYSPNPDSFLLTIQEKSILNYYLLQSKPGNLDSGLNQFSPWRENNFLASLNLISSDIGAILESYSGNGKHFLPLTIRNSNNENTTQGFNAIFRLSKSIKGGLFSVFKGKFTGVPKGGTLVEEKEIRRHNSGATFRIQINEEKLQDYEGWVTVKLNLQKKGSRDKIPYSFYFYCPKD